MLKRFELRRLADTVLLGVAGALCAQAFVWMVRFCQTLFLNNLAGYTEPGLSTEGPPHPQTIGPHGLWLIPVATTLGGLITGLLISFFAPEAEGHGTDTVVESFHHAGGVLRARVPFLKMLASAITIGSGGSAGREGPTALITAGLGSIYADLTKRSEQDRRLLLVIGMAAGLSAIFRSPIGTAVFAIEVLYGGMEFESRALLYTTLASIIAYAITGFFVGLHPLFEVSRTLIAPGFKVYLWYSLLGVACGLFGVLLPNLFYRGRELFRRIPCPAALKPAIGGLGVGLIALAFPQVLGGGYGWMQQAIDGRLAFGLLLTLLFLKMIAFVLTISSGGSGGVFAPSLYVGAMLGGALAVVCRQPAAAFTIVGMAALFGAAARVPVAALLMVTEMTGGFQLLIPAGLAVMIAFLIQRSLAPSLKYDSLYEAQVTYRMQSPAHYLESLETAFDLIGRKRVPKVGNLGKLDLTALLESGIPLQLAEDNQLFLGVVRPGSPFIGQTLAAISDSILEGGWRVLAIVRESKAHAAEGDTVLEEHDKPLIMCSPETREQLAKYLLFEASPSDKDQVEVSPLV